MPVATLRYPAGRDLRKIATALSERLPAILATHLSVEGAEVHEGALTEKEIIVHVERLERPDINGPDFQILVFAHDYRKRKKTLEARKDAIAAEVKQFCEERGRRISGFVWIILAPTAFGDF